MYFDSLFSSREGLSQLIRTIEGVSPKIKYNEKVILFLKDISKIYLQQLVEEMVEVMEEKKTKKMTKEVVREAYERL